MARGPESSRLGATLRTARHQRGWSRETLAHESGLSWAAITQIETGRRTEVRVSSLVALAEALRVSVDYLVRCEVAPLMYEHRAYLFDSPAHLASMMAPTISSALEAGRATLVVTTKPNIAALKKALHADAKHVVFGTEADWYTTPTEVATRFNAFAREALTTCDWVHLYGGPVLTGRTRAEVKAWMRYESLMNVTFAPWPISGGCLYDVQSLPKGIVTDVERTHPEVVTQDGARVSSSYEPTIEFVTS